MLGRSSRRRPPWSTPSPFACGVIANGQLAKMQPVPAAPAAYRRRWRDARTSAWPRGPGSSNIDGLHIAVDRTGRSRRLGHLLARDQPESNRVALVVGTLAITALGLAIPWAMHTVDISGTAGLVLAAPVPGLQHPPALSPVATLGSLFMATGPWDGHTPPSTTSRASVPLHC